MVQSPPLTLVILAAGAGTRFGGLKQLKRVGPNAEAVLDYSIYDALRAGFEKIVMVVREETEPLFREHFNADTAADLGISYIHQALPPGRDKPWGTGEAVLACEPLISGPFGVVNGDDFYGAGSYEVLADGLRGDGFGPSRYLMVGFTLENTLSEHGSVSRGICDVSMEGRLKRITEAERIEKCERGAEFLDSSGRLFRYSGKEPVSMNMWGLHPSFFEYLGSEFEGFKKRSKNESDEFYLPSALNQLIGIGTVDVEVLATNEMWMGITYREDAKEVRQKIARLAEQTAYPRPLWS